MIHSIIPYDDIFPTGISEPHMVHEDDLVRGHRGGSAFEAISRAYTTDLRFFLRPWV